MIRGGGGGYYYIHRREKYFFRQLYTIIIQIDPKKEKENIFLL